MTGSRHCAWENGRTGGQTQSFHKGDHQEQGRTPKAAGNSCPPWIVSGTPPWGAPGSHFNDGSGMAGREGGKDSQGGGDHWAKAHTEVQKGRGIWELVKILEVALRPDVRGKLRGKSPSGGGPLLPSGAPSGEGTAALSRPGKQSEFWHEKKAPPAPWRRQPGGKGETQSPSH